MAAVQYSALPCRDVLVFEPPYAWTADVTPRLLILPARGERLSSGFTLWWERATDSFTTAGTGQVFGRRGTLNTPLDATGFLCHEGGLDVTFTVGFTAGGQGGDFARGAIVTRYCNPATVFGGAAVPFSLEASRAQLAVEQLGSLAVRLVADGAKIGARTPEISARSRRHQP